MPQHNAADQGEVEIERKKLAGPYEHEGRAGRQHADRWRFHKIGESIHKEERDPRADGNGEARSDDALPEFLQVVQKPHRAFMTIIVPLFGWEWARGFGHRARL